MPGTVPINRHSAPIPGNGSAGSESLLPGPLAPRQIRASVPLPEAREGGFRGIDGHPGPIGQPVQLTLPPPPGGPTEGSAELGVASIAQGMDKVSQARVDVARRGFWRKCLSVAAATTALVLMSVATGGLGAAGLVSLGLTAAFVAKGSADTVLSLMNWRNLKAGRAGQPPPFSVLNRLPEAVRTDATAAMLVGLGAPLKTSIWVSRAFEIGLGLGAVAAYGFDAGGIGEAVTALAPFLIGDRLSLISERLEVHRQTHAQSTFNQMNGVARQTVLALQDLQALQDRVLSATRVTREASRGDSVETRSPTDALIARAQVCQDDARTILVSLKQQWLDRVMQKSTAGLGGVVAEVLDGSSESASYTADLLAETSMPFIMVGALAGRAVIEGLRTVRSAWRDQDKLQRFTDQHRSLQHEIAALRHELRAELDDLEAQRPEALRAFEESLRTEDSALSEPPPLPGDPRYV